MPNKINMQISANMNASQVTGAIKEIQRELSKLKLPNDIGNNLKSIYSSLESELIKFQNQLNSGFVKNSDLSNLEKSGKSIISLFNRMGVEINKIDTSILKNSFDFDISKVRNFTEQISNLKDQLNSLRSNNIESIQKEINDLKEAGSKSKSLENFLNSIETNNFNAAEKSLRQLEGTLKRIGETNPKFDVYNKSIKALRDSLNSLRNNEDLERINREIIELENNIEKVKADEFRNLSNNVKSTKSEFNNLSDSVRESVNELTEVGRATLQFNNELENVKGKIQYFFGLENAVQLFKNAVTDAFNTVKELDAAMTETAVVTDFNISDMWASLPEYTKLANELGTTTLGAYETMTLFYQQGLNTQQSFEVGTEAMKMARIAGLDYAESTNLMTAALRGFNMELNKTTAQLVNDVYSELAAITAADTEEIATAMTKTASLAHNANMKFETTAALLSQIIETTREAPETAGTALKTIIARFSEVKELYDQGKNAGVDEEGEVINVNDIQEALRSIGISMTEFLEGTEGLDQVFLKLAEKWDTLDVLTQRYL